MGLYGLMCNYDTHRFSEEMHVTARINGKVIYSGIYDVRFYCDSNYRSVTISFPEGKLPLEYREALGNKYPVGFSYDSDGDQLRMTGEVKPPYFKKEGSYDILIQLPQKYNI